MGCSINAEANTYYASCGIDNDFSVTLESSDGTGEVMVNANQIYINVRSDEKTTTTFLLTKPADLGPGGVRLDWDNFSNSQRVFTLVQLDENSVALKWFGFWHEINNEYSWTVEGKGGPALSSGWNILTQCK